MTSFVISSRPNFSSPHILSFSYCFILPLVDDLQSQGPTMDQP